MHGNLIKCPSFIFRNLCKPQKKKKIRCYVCTNVPRLKNTNHFLNKYRVENCSRVFRVTLNFCFIESHISRQIRLIPAYAHVLKVPPLRIKQGADVYPPDVSCTFVNINMRWFSEAEPGLAVNVEGRKATHIYNLNNRLRLVVWGSISRVKQRMCQWKNTQNQLGMLYYCIKVSLKSITFTLRRLGSCCACC